MAKHDHLTVGMLMERWLLSINKELKPSTYALYQNYSHKYLLPLIADMDTHTFDKDALYSTLSYIYDKNGTAKPRLANNTIYILEEIIRAVFRYGAKEGLVPEKNFGKVQYRIAGKKEVYLLSELEIQQLLHLLNHQPFDFQIQIMLPLYTGISLSELCGLKWEDIDLVKGTIYIHRNVKRVQIRKQDGSTGTAISTYELDQNECRSFEMPALVLQLLKEAYRTHSPAPSYYVATLSNRAAEGRTLQYRLKNIAIQLGFDILSYRALRDTFAVMCLQAGGDIYSLAYVLGITIVAAVERYGDWMIKDHTFLQRIG